MDTKIHSQSVARSTAALIQHMLVVSHQSSAIERPLLHRSELVNSISTANGISVPRLGAAPLFDGVRLITHTTPNWAFYNLSHDPVWATGSFPVPRQHLRRLKRLYRVGVEFDALYVAHELPANFHHEEDLIELEWIKPSPPATALRLSQNLGFAADRIISFYAALIAKPVKALAVVGDMRLRILQDPVLMGAIVSPGVNPEEGVPAIWFLLAAWKW